MFRLALPRRSFLAGASATLGGLATGVLPRLGLAAPKDVPVYVLSTTSPGCGHGCRHCNACQRHADNKVFASKTAVFRAHPKCDCAIVQRSLPQGTWTALFGNEKHPHTLSVDRRNQKVAALLKRF